MSTHPSLRTKKTAGSMRNVLKRHERVRHLMGKAEWQEGRSVFGLPKIKVVKMKAKKAAKEEKEEASAETPKGTPAAPPSGSS